MDGKDDSEQIGTGKSPEGAAVSYHEVFRPETIGAKGATGVVIIVRDAEGKKVTHSDSLEGLKKAGFTVDGPAASVPPVVPPAPKVVPAPAPAAAAPSLEEQL